MKEEPLLVSWEVKLILIPGAYAGQSVFLKKTTDNPTTFVDSPNNVGRIELSYNSGLAVFIIGLKCKITTNGRVSAYSRNSSYCCILHSAMHTY